MAGVKSSDLLFAAVGQVSYEKLTDAVALGAIRQPFAIWRRLRVVMQGAGGDSVSCVVV